MVLAYRLLCFYMTVKAIWKPVGKATEMCTISQTLLRYTQVHMVMKQLCLSVIFFMHALYDVIVLYCISLHNQNQQEFLMYFCPASR